MNYYNEIDEAKAAWIRELIVMKLVPPGVVDTRSITDVQPSDLSGFAQCHFFAGVLGFPLALQRAGWPSDRNIWTGSCPCQPYSAAGKQLGHQDPRDLWWAFFRLISECQPDVVIGEQVSRAIGHGWLDRVSADLEGAGYACGHCVLGAHSVGAPHQRQRLYWLGSLADANGGDASAERKQCGREQRFHTEGGRPCHLDNPERPGLEGLDRNGLDGSQSGRNDADEAGSTAEAGGLGRGMGHAERDAAERDAAEPWRPANQSGEGNAAEGAGPHAQLGRHGLLGSSWSGFELVPCRDGKFRRVESGTFPLVASLPRGVVPSGDPCAPGYANETSEARRLRLAGYGDAICVETAELFIRSFMEVIGE